MHKPTTPTSIAKYIKDKKLVLDIRDYQLRIISKALNYVLVDGVDSIMIESPTGSGKTVMGQVIVQYLHDIGFTKSQSWIAMRKELLKQAHKHSTKIGADYNMHYVSMFNKRPPIVDTVVIDECQHDATESSTSQHIIVKPKLTIGMSATPYRQDSAKLFFKRIIRDANTRILIKAGYLAKFNHWMIDDWTPESVATTYLNEIDKWGKSIVFFRTLEECKIFKCILETADINVELVTADSDRDSQLAAFESGEVSVLVNMMILTEGFDSNTIHTAFIRDSSKGPTRQMTGRVLRRDGDAIKNVVQSRKTGYTFLKVADGEVCYLQKDGIWEVIEKNKKVDEMHDCAMSAIIATIRSEEEKTEKLMASYKKIGWGISKKKRREEANRGSDSDE